MASGRSDNEDVSIEALRSHASGHELELEPTVSVVANRIATLLAEARLAEVRVRFAVGDQVHILRRSVDGGEQSPVRQLARQLGLDQSGLHRIARVAERIRGTERESMLSLIEARGSVLSWSHLEELERVHTLDARLRLACDVAADGLSVRELRRRLRCEETVSKSIGPTLATMDNDSLHR